ncbi:MAG: GGDEF domain-containing protein [Pseudomonadales bacterium]|nr:GGDEF domain-containing protein [Pseudomonadales bacterium]
MVQNSDTTGGAHAELMGKCPLNMIEELASFPYISAKNYEHLRQAEKAMAGRFYQTVVKTLTDKIYPEPQAHHVWLNMLEHKKNMAAMLGRDPGMRVAALDYFCNLLPGENDSANIEEMQPPPSDGVSFGLDTLTKLYEASVVDIVLEEMDKQAAHHNPPFSLAKLDIDNFVLICDEYGCDFGDRVLVMVGEVLDRYVRDSDIVARYGENEFVILFKHTEVERAKEITDRIRTVIKQTPIKKKHFTVSAGLAHYPTHHASPREVFRLAHGTLSAQRPHCKDHIAVFGG